MKKKKKYKAYSTLLALAISLTGCSNQVERFENKQEKEVYTTKKPLEKKEPKNERIQKDKQVENSEISIKDHNFLQNSYVNVFIEESFSTITITGKKKKIHQFNELPDEFYQQLNIVIQEQNITSLYFKNLDGTFDFSKIDSANITELELDTCSGNINLTKNNLLKLEEISLCNCTGNLKGINAEMLQFFNTPLKVVKSLLLEQDISKTKIYWTEDGKKKRNLKSLLEYLVENNMNIEQFTITEINSPDYNGMTTEEFDLLSKLEAKYIYIEDENFKEPLHLDLILNKSIQELDIKTYYKKEGQDIINGELGNVKIRTNNKQFHCDFGYMDITKNTHFSLPNGTWLSFNDLECRDISAFDELSNITYLWFKENLGPGAEANTIGSVTYCRDSSQQFIDVNTNEIVKPFRKYDEFLDYLKMCKGLEKIQKTLNISREEENKYENIISIGDIVNLKEEDTPIYTEVDSNRPTTSYYETSELRCIRSISLAKDEKEIEIDNMEDYETFTKLGFVVKKYNLVNQYSLNADGSLTTEAYCDKGGVQLVYTPFHPKK